MLSAVFSRAMSTVGARWLAITGAMLASLLLVLVVAAVLVVPTFKALVMDVQAAQQEAIAGSASSGSVEIADPITGSGGEFGSPVVDPAAQAAATQARQQAALDAARPDAGTMVKLGIGMLVVYALLIATSTSGVFAAAGLGVKDAMVQGARTTPHALVQALRVTWPGLLAYGMGFVLAFLVPGIGMVVAIPLTLAGFVLLLRQYGTAMLTIGSIAHGHVSFDPALARAATEGRRWNATGVAIVGAIVGGLVPIAGAVFLSAYLSAMWEEYGDDTGPREADALDPDPHGETGRPASATGGATSAPHLVGATAGTVAAVPAAPAAMTPQLVAGPTWNGAATAQHPCGSWVTLAHPASIGLQVQWVGGDAPALMVADATGAWSTPPAQPAASGEAIWLELPAGNSWVALLPRSGQGQQVWVATWLPSNAAAAAA